jgi:hypothetical protein
MMPRRTAIGIPTPSPTFAPVVKLPVDEVDTAAAVARPAVLVAGLVEEKVWVKLVEKVLLPKVLTEEEDWVEPIEEVLVLELLELLLEEPVEMVLEMALEMALGVLPAPPPLEPLLVMLK